MSIEKLITASKYGGVLAVCLEMLTILYFYIISPSSFGGENPISYFASLDQTKYVFTFGFLFAAISFVCFVWFYLRKLYETPVFLFLVSMLSFIAVAVVPYDPSNSQSESLHVLLAQIFHVSFVVGVFLMGKNNDMKKIKNSSYGVVVFNIIILVPFMLTREGSNLLLFLELMIGLSNQIWVLFISFYSFSKESKQFID